MQQLIPNKLPEKTPIPGHIAICMPCIDKPHLLTAFSLAKLCYQMGRFSAPVCTITANASIIVNARNNCIASIEEIESQGVPIDYIFFIDADMVFPEYTLLILLKHQKDIVGCTYLRRTPPYDLHGKGLSGKPEKVDGKGLIEVAALPTGCLLIKREIFKKLKRPYFRLLVDEERGLTIGEDYTFCAAVRSLGYKLWLDTELSKHIGHISEKPLYPDQAGWGEVKATPEFKLMKELRKAERANG